ncbi:MAG TPA: hypothetical protein VJ777_24555, partial [Mycobacterium sp.]|nr:hypothetical protein [Mycobacterium sp.]
MFTRLTLGTDGSMAKTDHFIDAMVLTVSAIGCAEIARPVRFLNIEPGIALLIAPFLYEASDAQMVGSLDCGAGLIVLSGRRGPFSGRVG